jgi:hypothetical protein
MVYILNRKNKKRVFLLENNFDLTSIYGSKIKLHKLVDNKRVDFPSNYFEDTTQYYYKSTFRIDKKQSATSLLNSFTITGFTLTNQSKLVNVPLKNVKFHVDIKDVDLGFSPENLKLYVYVKSGQYTGRVGKIMEETKEGTISLLLYPPPFENVIIQNTNTVRIFKKNKVIIPSKNLLIVGDHPFKGSFVKFLEPSIGIYLSVLVEDTLQKTEVSIENVVFIPDNNENQGIVMDETDNSDSISSLTTNSSSIVSFIDYPDDEDQMDDEVKIIITEDDYNNSIKEYMNYRFKDVNPFVPYVKLILYIYRLKDEAEVVSEQLYDYYLNVDYKNFPDPKENKINTMSFLIAYLFIKLNNLPQSYLPIDVDCLALYPNGLNDVLYFDCICRKLITDYDLEKVNIYIDFFVKNLGFVLVNRENINEQKLIEEENYRRYTEIINEQEATFEDIKLTEYAMNVDENNTYLRNKELVDNITLYLSGLFLNEDSQIIEEFRNKITKEAILFVITKGYYITSFLDSVLYLAAFTLCGINYNTELLPSFQILKNRQLNYIPLNKATSLLKQEMLKDESEENIKNGLTKHVDILNSYFKNYLVVKYKNEESVKFEYVKNNNFLLSRRIKKPEDVFYKQVFIKFASIYSKKYNLSKNVLDYAIGSTNKKQLSFEERTQYNDLLKKYSDFKKSEDFQFKKSFKDLKKLIIQDFTNNEIKDVNINDLLVYIALFRYIDLFNIIVTEETNPKMIDLINHYYLVYKSNITRLEFSKMTI